MFETWSPTFSKYFFENTYKPRCDERAKFWVNVFKHIKGYWPFFITWVKNNRMIGSIFWDISDHSFSEVSMRINDRKSSSLSHIINNHILKQGRFSHPRLPDNIHMTTSIIWSDSKRDFCPTKIGGSDRSKNILLSLNYHWEVYWWFKSTRGYPTNRRCFYIHRR